MTGDNPGTPPQGDKSGIDVSSPYFLAPADQPGQNFVGENLLRDGNYSDWSNEMMNALLAKNKIGFVDGTIPMPAEGSKDMMNWRRCNAMVRGWLVSAMEKEIKGSVKYAITAREIWLDLKERFGKENAPRAYELRRIVTTIQQGNMTVSAYYTKLRGVWDEIQSISAIPTCSCNGCTCGVAKEFNKIRDKERLYDFLMGLNDEFGAVKTQILSSSPLLTLGAAYHLVSQDEQQRLIGQSRSTTETTAFQTFGKNSSKHTGKSNSLGNGKRDERGKGKYEDRVCSHCHKSGHTMDGCFELIGYPEWWTIKPKTDAKPQPTKLRSQPRAVAVNNESISLTKDDYDRLMQMLQTAKAKETTSMANMTGLTFEESDWDG